MFFSFEISTSNTLENETGKKFKSLLGINLIKYSSEFLARLGHTGKSTSVRNSCIKLSGCGVDVTKLFVHREITGNILCREKFFSPKICSPVFSTNLI